MIFEFCFLQNKKKIGLEFFLGRNESR